MFWKRLLKNFKTYSSSYEYVRHHRNLSNGSKKERKSSRTCELPKVVCRNVFVNNQLRRVRAANSFVMILVLFSDKSSRASTVGEVREYLSENCLLSNMHHKTAQLDDV